MTQKKPKQARRHAKAAQERRPPRQAVNGSTGDLKATAASLADLRQDPRNANTGNDRGREMLEASFRKYGAARSLVADRNGVIIGGNKSQLAALAAGINDAILVPTDGRRLVVVQRTDLDLGKDPKAAELAVADNRTNEIGLTWDADALQALADSGVDISDLFTDKELARILASATPSQGRTDPDAAPPERRTSIRTGDYFELGEHRLLCGDATKASTVAVLMGDATAVLMNTDPPYGIDYSKLKDGIPRSGFKDHQQQWGDIENDSLTDGAALQAFLESVIRTALPHLAPTCAFYFWHPMLTQGTFFAAAAAADIVIHRQIIWVKPGFVLTRSGQYHWQHELCFYGWIRGNACPWYGEKNQTSVWPLGRDGDAGQHPTQKPVELFARPMLNHCRRSDVAYEPFSGSGSQIIAGEQRGVKVRALEIAPRYCQVAIDRWEAFTGKKATKVGEATEA